MKYPVKRFIDLTVALREIEPFVKDAQALRTGRPSKAFLGLRPREIWANWLLCAAINGATGRDLEFTTDPTGGDGIIRDRANGNTWPTEHVFVRPVAERHPKVEQLILDRINQKNGVGGAPYAGGKTLVVFVDVGSATPWSPHGVLRGLPQPLHFDAVWVISLSHVEADGSYHYDATCLDVEGDDVSAWRVHVAADFGGWKVVRLK